MTLAELAVLDWTRLIRGLATAGGGLAGDADRRPAVMMAERMVTRTAREGAHILAWAGTPLDLARVTAGAGRRTRAAFVAGAELAGCGAEIPAGFAQVQRAFAGDGDRRPALIAMFVEAGRRVEQLVEQLELAGATEPVVNVAARELARSLARAHLKPFRPRGEADFDHVRAIAYTSAGKPGDVVAVQRPGLVWHGHVVRKADVVVSERMELLEGSTTTGTGS